MGSVWEAVHELLDMRVAVKLISTKSGLPRSKTNIRFAREARTLAKLTNPFIVRVLDYGIANEKIPYMVLEYLDATSLDQHLKANTQLNLDELEKLVIQLGSALAATHSAGIIHRDVKPSNIMLLNSGSNNIKIKLIDFGIAKVPVSQAKAAITERGALVGSLKYMSPEQISSPSSIDHHTDLWAFGAVVYRALTGAHAISGKSLAEIIAETRSLDIRLPSQFAPDFASGIFDAWFARALAELPEHRFHSASEMTASFLMALKDHRAELASKEQRDALDPSGNEEADTIEDPPSFDCELVSSSTSEASGAATGEHDDIATIELLNNDGSTLPIRFSIAAISPKLPKLIEPPTPESHTPDDSNSCSDTTDSHLYEATTSTFKVGPPPTIHKSKPSLTSLVAAACMCVLSGALIAIATGYDESASSKANDNQLKAASATISPLKFRNAEEVAGFQELRSITGAWTSIYNKKRDVIRALMTSSANAPSAQDTQSKSPDARAKTQQRKRPPAKPATTTSQAAESTQPDNGDKSDAHDDPYDEADADEG